MLEFRFDSKCFEGEFLRIELTECMLCVQFPSTINIHRNNIMPSNVKGCVPKQFLYFLMMENACRKNLAELINQSQQLSK